MALQDTHDSAHNSLPKPEPVSVWSEEGQAEVYSGRDGWAVVRDGMVDGSRDQGGRFGVLDKERRLIYPCRESSDGSLTYVNAAGETHTLDDAGYVDVIIG